MREKIVYKNQNLLLIKELNDQGKTRKEIANIIGLHQKQVEKICGKFKIKSPNLPVDKIWTEDEEKLLKERIASGSSYRALIKVFNCSYERIRNKAKELGVISPLTTIRERGRELFKEGKRMCMDCCQIFPITSEYFPIRSITEENKTCNGQKYICLKCEKIYNDNRRLLKVNTLTEMIRKKVYNAKRAMAERNLEFSISVGEIIEMYNNQDGKCFYTGLPMAINDRVNEKCKLLSFSMDRIDSSKGYFRKNLVLCLSAVNRMKSNLPVDLFLQFCNLIAKTHNGTLKEN